MDDNTDVLLEPLFKGQLINIGEFPESHSQHVRDIAKKYGHAERHLFCEMLLLSKSGDDYCWWEEARWIKYEETVEGTKERWSKPHVPLLTIKGLLQLRNCFSRGAVLLDLTANTFPQIVDKVVRSWEEGKLINDDTIEAVRALLLSNKEHVNSKRHLRLKLHSFSPSSRRVSIDNNSLPTPPNGDLDVNVSCEDDRAEETLEKAVINVELSKKLPENAEVACILLGQTEFVTSSVSAFVRLNEAKSISNCSEVNRKLRFLFVLLAPEDVEDELEMIGRTMGVALTDDVFVHCAYGAEDATELCHAIDEIICSALIIPPGKWSLENRLEPSDSQKMITHLYGRRLLREINAQRRTTFTSGYSCKKVGIKRSVHEIHTEGLQYTGRPFGGFRDDIARKVPHWISDFTAPFLSVNAFSQCLAASLYLFFANFTNIITFGGIMGKMLQNHIAVIESIISGCISGLIFGSFSGQPLNIMSATGPVLIFETIFYKFCGSHGWAFLPARFWLGFWTSIFLFVLVAFDASFLVAYITRFTEESFATLIAVIFIFESFQALMNLAGNAPITKNLTNVLEDPCRCMLNENSTTWWDNVTNLNECSALNGTLKGAMCQFHPDVFTFSLVLFTLTFLLAYTFHVFRNSRFFPSKIRSFVADFNVFITIVIMTIFSFFIGVPVETLNVPTNFKPSMDRNWLVDLSDLADWWIILVCIFPGIFLTVLIVMDQQITAVIVNRKDNKLKKGFGYHLDLAFVAVLVLLCSLFGLPFFVAATILSITHVQSLRIESECSAPGEKPRFLGVREQRVTAIFAHLLIGISIFLAPIQKYIPIAVLLGIFLYMGVTTMLTQQFVERILLFITPVKYQPDYVFLRIVPLKRVFLFTAVQLGAFMLLCAVKYTKDISMLFPILLVVLVFVRKWLDRVFSQKELLALDDILPAFAALVKRKTPSISLPCALNSRLTSGVEHGKNEEKLLI